MTVHTTSLLSLLPPSCMVVPIRELGNITLSNTTLCSTTYNMAWIQDTDTAVDPVKNLFTDDEVRGHSLALSVHRPRSPSISSSESDEEYHVHVKRDSDRMNENEPVSSVGNSWVDIFYQCGSNEVLASSLPSGSNMFNIQLNYNINQALDPESWDSKFHAVSLHESMEHLASDVKNIKESLWRMGKYIKARSVNANPNDVKNLDSIGKEIWKFLSVVYNSHWDGLQVDDSKTSFRNKVKSKFNPQVLKSQANNKDKKTVKPTYVSPLSSPILAKTPKEVNEVSKYFKKIDSPQKKSYTQASSKSQSSSSSNVTMNMLKIKEMFLKLQNKKIDQVQKIINGGERKPKSCINMTTRDPFYKQIIVPMNKEMANKYIKDASTYISSINSTLKSIKSSIIADFVWADDRGIIISTNNIALFSNLQEVEKIIKSLLQDDEDQIASSCLPQLKSYLKIVVIPYLNDQTNIHILSEDIKKILKKSHIFNKIVLVSKPWVINVSPKLDMAIIWINIWDTQNGSNTKKIINRYFNVGRYITTVCSANMNPGMPQCKNCWKWDHMAGVCHIQGAKCVKCNGSLL